MVESAVVARRPRAKPIPTRTGLAHLLDKSRISRTQYDAGQRYGAAARAAQMSDAAAIKSALGNLQDGAGGGGGTKLTPGKFDYEAAEWIAACRAEVRQVRLHFFEDCGLMAVLDCICMKQMAPREITQDRHQTEEIEATLRTCLTMLASFYKKMDDAARRGASTAKVA